MRLFRDKGTQVAMGRASSPCSRAVRRGTTVVNGASCGASRRTPTTARSARSARTSIPLAASRRAWTGSSAIRRGPADAPRGNGTTMKRGAEKLGWKAHAIAATSSTARAVAAASRRVHEAQAEHGAHVLPRRWRWRAHPPDHEVRGIETSAARVTGVSGRRSDGSLSAWPHPASSSRRARSSRRASSSARGSPATHVARTSRASRHGGGGGLPRSVRLWEGATQSFEVDEFRSQGFKMEVVGLRWSSRACVFRRGADFQRSMGTFRTWRCGGCRSAPRRRARLARGDRARITYTRPALTCSSSARGPPPRRASLPAGAIRVYPGVQAARGAHVTDSSLSSTRCARFRATGRSSPATSSRPAAWDAPRTMASSASTARSRRTRLWALDASALPTNLGVNPQHTIMSLAIAPRGAHLGGPLAVSPSLGVVRGAGVTPTAWGWSPSRGRSRPPRRHVRPADRPPTAYPREPMLLAVDVGNTNIVYGLFEARRSSTSFAWRARAAARPTSTPSAPRPPRDARPRRDGGRRGHHRVRRPSLNEPMASS